MFEVEDGEVVSCHEQSLGKYAIGEEADCL
jgi:hypothetical protein